MDDNVEQQPVQTTDLSPIEARLNRITDTLAGMQREGESREIRSRLAAHELAVTNKLNTAMGAVQRAESDLASAIESGDSVAIARANRALVESVAARETAKGEKAEFEAVKADATRRTGGSSGAPGTNQPQTQEKDTTNLNDWKSRNGSWYGVDAGMTKAAHEIDRNLREAGVIPVGSQQYFQAIDRQMAQRFPEKLRSTPDTGSGGGGSRASAGPRAGQIPQHVLDGWERMGIDVKDDKVLTRMVNSRATLVEKGILPETPQYGMVRAR